VLRPGEQMEFFQRKMEEPTLQINVLALCSKTPPPASSLLDVKVKGNSTQPPSHLSALAKYLRRIKNS